MNETTFFSTFQTNRRQSGRRRGGDGDDERGHESGTRFGPEPPIQTSPDFDRKVDLASDQATLSSRTTLLFDRIAKNQSDRDETLKRGLF